MIAVPGARGALASMSACKYPQHNLNPPAFHRPRDALFLFLWILNSIDLLSFRRRHFFAFSSNTCQPFQSHRSVVMVPASRYCGEASWLAALLCPTHNRVNQPGMLTFTALQRVWTLPLFRRSICWYWASEISAPSRRCQQRRSMAPSRRRSPPMLSLWAATFGTICSLKFQQRLPIEVKGAKLPIGCVPADIVLQSEASTRLLNPKLLSLPQSMATGIHLLGH